MALTVAINRKLQGKGNSLAGYKIVLGTITFDSSYPTGGEAIAASDFGLTAIEAMFFSSDVLAATTALSVLSYDRTTGKVRAVGSNGAAPAQLVEIANTTDLSAQISRVVVFGY
jgi:hypothetical protein